MKPNSGQVAPGLRTREEGLWFRGSPELQPPGGRAKPACGTWAGVSAWAGFNFQQGAPLCGRNRWGLQLDVGAPV